MELRIIQRRKHILEILRNSSTPIAVATICYRLYQKHGMKLSKNYNTDASMIRRDLSILKRAGKVFSWSQKGKMTFWSNRDFSQGISDRDLPRVRRMGDRFDISRINDIRDEFKNFQEHIENERSWQLRSAIVKIMLDRKMGFETVLMRALETYLNEEGYLPA